MIKNEIIVIAEDSLTQAVQLQFILENQGYTVFIGKNGKEALALVNEKNPALVISDIVMPEIDGFELCRLIKSKKETQNLPVIILTSLTETNDVINGLECGADSFINKPYSEEFLLLHINNTLQSKKLNIKYHSNINFDIAISGKERHFKVDPVRMVSLLISTYESAINKNIELNQKQKELNALNNNLEDIVIERTAELWGEIAVRKQSEANVRLPIL
ncbi:MAG: response regulator [Salinivirgaceae bacterium]|nr:response regulator [Salinivirgaceae bacterium]